MVGGDTTFANFKFLDNTVQIDKSGVIGFVFRGNVTSAVIAGNKVLADTSSGRRYRHSRAILQRASLGRIKTTFINPTR